ncbi:FAD-binding protein [Xylanimonas protaetiae]|uniref:FAD-binding protein n=1 Tax=Xylanimonas protaetiae TaxID=2509457 RepID=UPI002477E23C|nr:FAD-binding protein [Xylanimonas protaetiae]
MPVGDAVTPAWENWARTAGAHPAGLARPRDEAEVAGLVARAAGQDRHVRARGAGHSFSPVAVTDGLQLDLDELSGIEAVERRHDGTARVTVRAGTRLFHLHHLLAAYGLAMTNLGDVDRETLAGAVSTGTHGTGLAHRGLAAQVCGARLVTADGTVRDVGVDDAVGTPARELFELARLGLGTAGVLTAVTLEVVPAFWLRSREAPEALGAFLDDPDAFARSADHAALLWFPGTPRVLTVRNDRLAPRRPRAGAPTAPASGAGCASSVRRRAGCSTTRCCPTACSRWRRAS